VNASRVYVYVRSGSQVETDKSVYFTSDRVAVKAAVRVGLGFPHPARVVRMRLAAS
jgi:hypothetical protein